MSTYVIGDLQGCYRGLMDLLDHIAYHPQHDRLWFCGDMINRGPESLETIDWLMQGKNIQLVLGNHDLHALAIAHNAFPGDKPHTLEKIMNAPKKWDYIEWLRHLPLIHQEGSHLMVHAGIYPAWSIDEACSYAQEVSDQLMGKDYAKLLHHMYGNTPDQWSPDLEGYPRYRFILNALTRMRFITRDLRLDFEHTMGIGSQPDHLVPWFECAHQRGECIVMFGHWSALQGKINQPFLKGLDGGYVWGNQLIAYEIEKQTHHIIEKS